ncbi:MAG TPA: hypothetical protein VGR70_20870 [Stellaceae bacterium]|nr:hypothetical protein [Stellaceae bacterium]
MSMLGEDPITSINPADGSRRSVLAAQFYDPSRRAMLESACWKCAKRQASLVAAASVPLFEFNNAYPIPADYIRSFKVVWSDREPYELMNLAGIGRCIVTNDGSPLNLDYIFDLQDCTQMDPLLVMAIAADLAAVLAVPLAHDVQLKRDAEADREGRLAIARTTDAQQNRPREFDVDVLLRSRF